MDDPAALAELISVLKDNVINKVGLFLERSTVVEFGGDDDACGRDGDAAHLSSSIRDCLAAAAVDFPFLAEVNWDAERERRLERRRLRQRKTNAARMAKRECRAEGCSKQWQSHCEGYCKRCFSSLRRDGLSIPPREEDDDDDMEEGQKEENDDGRTVHSPAASEPAFKWHEEDEATTEGKEKRQVRRLPWDEHLAEFVRWKEEHGHPHVPSTKGEHYRLGQWVRDQRRSYRAYKEARTIGTRTPIKEERMAKLTKAGFAFEPPDTDAAGRKRKRDRTRLSWDENLAEFTRWKEEHGGRHHVPKGEHGRLGQWVYDQRVSYKAFREGTKIKGRAVMTEERAAKLREAGFSFETDGRRKKRGSGVAPPVADSLEDSGVDPPIADNSEDSGVNPPVTDILEEAEPEVESFPCQHV